MGINLRRIHYRKLVGDAFARFRCIYEDQFIKFFKEGESLSKEPLILGIEYPDHPNPYADGISMRLRVLGLTNLLYRPCNNISDVDVKDKNVLIIDLHAAPEPIVQKYMDILIKRGANDVRYFSPVPKPIYYNLENLKEFLKMEESLDA